MSRDWLLYLDDLIDSAEKIARFVRNRSFESFVSDQMLFDAVLFNLEVIGEAAKKLPPDAKSSAPEANWSGPARMRDLIAHHYFSVDPQIVWEAATRQVPEILGHATRLRNRFDAGGQDRDEASATNRREETSMSTTTLSIRELEHRVGEEIAVSPWYEVTQERIDLFAKAIEDYQWIHVDPQRAKDSPFGTTIAHGFLTLSLLSRLVEMTFSFSDRKMGVNYGLNKVRFTAPVPAGSRIRARFALANYEKLDGGVQFTWKVTMEREGADKPCMVAEWLGRSYH